MIDPFLAYARYLAVTRVITCGCPWGLHLKNWRQIRTSVCTENPGRWKTGSGLFLDQHSSHCPGRRRLGGVRRKWVEKGRLQAKNEVRRQKGRRFDCTARTNFLFIYFEWKTVASQRGIDLSRQDFHNGSEWIKIACHVWGKRNSASPTFGASWLTL